MNFYKNLVIIAGVIITISPYFIVIFSFYLFFVLLKQGFVNFSDFIDLLNIIVWPLVLLSGLLFFKKVITYLFFSMDEFNFFGNKGTLKNIQEVINEKVDIILNTEKKEEEHRQLIENYENKIKTIISSEESSQEKIRNKEALFKEIFNKYKELVDENADLNNKIINLTRKNELERLRSDFLKERVNRNKTFYSRLPRYNHMFRYPSTSSDEVIKGDVDEK